MVVKGPKFGTAKVGKTERIMNNEYWIMKVEVYSQPMPIGGGNEE